MTPRRIKLLGTVYVRADKSKMVRVCHDTGNNGWARIQASGFLTGYLVNGWMSEKSLKGFYGKDDYILFFECPAKFIRPSPMHKADRYTSKLPYKYCVKVWDGGAEKWLPPDAPLSRDMRLKKPMTFEEFKKLHSKGLHALRGTALTWGYKQYRKNFT